ncbi:MAG: hypothetical protein JO127_16285 [Caulobacteraceae bacterium]|nr:hypothetical protein [Caulobacteraceae bacterium]
MLLAALLSSVASAALARPHAAPAAPAASADRAARIQHLEDEFNQMQTELNDLKSSGGASAATVTDMQAKMDAFAEELNALKTQTDTNTSDIATLKVPPAVVPSLPNGKPMLASSDGRFTANIRATIQFDAGKYFQDTARQATGVGAVDFRRSGGAGTGGFGTSGASGPARKLNSGTNFRRARFGIDGKVFGDFDYEAIFEFGGSGGEDAGHVYALDATWHPEFLKPFKVKVGEFEPIIGMEANISTGSMPLMERPSPAEVSRNIAAGDTRAAVQVFGNGDIGGGDQSLSAYWLASTAITGNTAGTINSTGSSTAQPFGEQYAWIGRAAIAPFSGPDWIAHLGVHGQYVFKPNDAGGPNGAGTIANGRYTVTLQDRPELRLDGTRLVSTGAIDAHNVWEVAVEAGFRFRNFYASGEYFWYGIKRNVNPCFTAPASAAALAPCASPQINPANVELKDPRFHGYYVEGSWVISGETRKYNQVNGSFDGPTPAYPFNPAAGTWGAWELAARFSDLDLNFDQGLAGLAPTSSAVRGGDQQIVTVGLNWYLNPTIRFMLDYQHVKISRLNPDLTAAGSFAAPIGAQIGQTYNTFEVRSQLQF